MIFKDKACAVCGNIYTPQSSSSVYCSKECRKIANRSWRKRKQANQKVKIKVSLNDTLAELNNFNKLYNTNLSYGKYLAYKSIGYLDTYIESRKGA